MNLSYRRRAGTALVKAKSQNGGRVAGPQMLMKDDLDRGNGELSSEVSTDDLKKV